MDSWAPQAPRIARAVEDVRKHTSVVPKVALVLGSGLGGYADTLEDRTVIGYGDIGSMPVSKIVGHAGNLVFGKVGALPVVAMQGRVHLYEGHPSVDIVFGVRLMRALGAETLLITNAAGGCGDGLEAGDLMRISDHINLTGRNCLEGPNEDALGTRFPDMSAAYDPELGALAHAVAKDDGFTLKSGVYVGLLGPTYETPAEVQMMKRLGADAVGMSTVLEVIAARHMGMRVLGISCITNLAAGISAHPLSHDEVTETATRVRARFQDLVRHVLERLADGEVSGDAEPIDWAELEARARTVQPRAYAPYSQYRVGAALLCRGGAIYCGANVENASYGLCLCAERSAVASAIAAGENRFVALVVATDGPVPAAPCGMCRQVIAEFERALPIRCIAPGAEPLIVTLEELLPHAFDADYLTRDGLR